MNGETLTGLFKKGQMILAQAGIKEAGLDAWLLLEYVTGKSRAYYFAYGEESVTESVAERYLELISRRAGHIPLQHLTHQAFFICLLNKPEFIQQLFLLQPVLLQQELLFQQQL